MSDNKYVVYRHYTGDKTIYIGIGTVKRALYFGIRNKSWHDYVAIHGKPSIEILYEGLTKEAAWACEELLIEQYKRTIDGGTLLNISTGGRGTRGIKHSAETRAKMSAAMRGKKRGPMSEEHRAAISAANRGKTNSPEARAKLSAAKTGKPGHSQGIESREKIRQGILAHWAAKRTNIRSFA